VNFSLEGQDASVLFPNQSTNETVATSNQKASAPTAFSAITPSAGFALNGRSVLGAGAWAAVTTSPGESTRFTIIDQVGYAYIQTVSPTIGVSQKATYTTPANSEQTLNVCVYSLTLAATPIAWNDFTGPLIYLNTPAKRTIALALNSFSGQYGVADANLLMTASVASMAPCVILFFALQKYFAESMARTGGK